MTLFTLLCDFNSLSDLEKRVLQNGYISDVNGDGKHYAFRDYSNTVPKNILQDLCEKGWLIYYNEHELVVRDLNRAAYYIKEEYIIFFKNISKLESLLNL